MKKQSIKPFVLWILLSEAVGALAAWLTRDGMKMYMMSVNKPSFSPPPALFPIVWTLLYALMGYGAARVSLSERSDARNISLNLFVAQLIVNFFWSLIFFRSMAFGLAFFWLVFLWILVFLMTLSFFRVDKIAAVLQIPYFLWLTFAAILNFAVWKLNT